MKRKEKVLEKKQWTAAAWDMLYLVQCGVNSVVPDLERVAKMDLEKVYARSRSQSLEALTYMALESLMQSNQQIPDENQVLPQWKEAKNKAIAKNLMMDVSREQLFAFMEERGIWHIALKGAFLSCLYPKYGMRQMADNDILFDPSFRQEVHDWFVEQGYEVESYQISNHDEYRKKPVYNFEMHVALFLESPLFPFAEYYLAIKERLLAKPEKTVEYYMTDEDCYLYIIAHEYKHYIVDGTGVRSLLDLYVYQKIKNKMDWEYINIELKKMWISTFERELRNLAQKIFDPEPKTYALTRREKYLIKKLLFSGTYGIKKDFWHNYMKRIRETDREGFIRVKAHYMISRLFPDRIYMEMWSRLYAPYFLQHRWLMPIAPFWRILKRGIEKRKQIKEELNVIRK